MSLLLPNSQVTAAVFSELHLFAREAGVLPTNHSATGPQARRQTSTNNTQILIEIMAHKCYKIVGWLRERNMHRICAYRMAISLIAILCSGRCRDRLRPRPCGDWVLALAPALTVASYREAWANIVGIRSSRDEFLSMVARRLDRGWSRLLAAQ